MSTSVLLCACLFFIQDAPIASGGSLEYPETRTVDHVDIYHGVQVSDPYRWLEEHPHSAPEVAQWIEQQNEVTFGYLHDIPGRDQIRDRLTEIWDYEKFTTPFRHGEKYYVFHNTGLQNQNVLFATDDIIKPGKVLLDPNSWSDEGTVALAGTSFTRDGSLMGYATSKAGSDWKVWRVRDLATGKDLPDVIRWTKDGSVAWTADNKGFYYARYPQPEEGQEFSAANENEAIYFHAMGTPQSEDTLIFSMPEQPKWGFAPTVTEDGRYLLVWVYYGTIHKYKVYLWDLQDPGSEPTELVGAFENDYSLLGNDGSTLFMKTDRDAPRGRVIAMDVANPSPEAWTEILPQTDATLQSVKYIDNHFITNELIDVTSHVRVYDKHGHHVRDVPLPGPGRVGGLTGRPSHDQTFFTFTNYTTPPTIFQYEVGTGRMRKLWQADINAKVEDFETEQVFYESKDGTRVPMFISYRKGLERDGKNPTLLYGYGGFNIAILPYFSISRLVWMEMGGIFAVANLRGGDEYGEAWHEDGMLMKKQNVFDDFIAAAEYLIDEGYTSPQHLAIQGGSNGGLLVGACMTQRPELIGAALPAVGVMDMLRFSDFTVGHLWVSEYGSTDHPDEFANLYAYSPLHNLEPGTEYPATMITTGDTDDRVVPAHSFKYAAALQKAHQGDAPVLIRVETSAGHGAGTPTTKRIDAVTDSWSFLANELGMKQQAEMIADEPVEQQ